MTALATMTFRKMNGLGNEFVILDGRRDPVTLSPAQVQAIADRQYGIGCDQLIVMEPAKGSDVRMRIWNNDGGEVESCGNASRCVADLLFSETGRETITIDTRGGLLICTKAPDGRVTVDMGAPRFEWQDIPLSEPFHDTRAIELQVGPIDKPLLHSPSVVNVGNPHCIFWVEDVTAHDLARFGPMLEFHPLFPERANISLCQVRDRGHLVLKVWERGAGLTRACGTAACAAAVAAARKDLAERSVRVTLPGGDLDIVWRESDDHILMTGPVTYEFTGELPEHLMAGAP
jgi:diaminopimelate epimerase